MAISKTKNFKDCYLYYMTNSSGDAVESLLYSFLIKGQRINYADQSFKPVRDELKSRVTAAVLYRMLQKGAVTLVTNDVELPASFKVMYAKDIKSPGKKSTVFMDMTGLIHYNNGIFTCKDIDKFSTYLIGALVNYLYYKTPDKIIRNANLQKYSVSAFVKMFAGVLDYLRVTGYMENREKILYIAGVYFAYSVIGLDVNQAKNVSQAANKISTKDASSFDYFYVVEDDFENIDTFITSLANTFKLTGLTTSIIVEKWLFRYGKGSMFALELYPAFLSTMGYAYSGTYVNNWKGIESVCGRDMVDLVNLILRIGADEFQGGFTYESATDRDKYAKAFREDNIADTNNSATPTSNTNNTPKPTPNTSTPSSSTNNNDDREANTNVTTSDDTPGKTVNSSSPSNNSNTNNNTNINKESSFVSEINNMADYRRIYTQAIKNKKVPEAGEKKSFVDAMDEDIALECGLCNKNDSEFKEKKELFKQLEEDKRLK